MIGQDLPALAIRRPLLVLVVNLLILLAGLAAIPGVEVRELPDIDRPIVTVRGDLPGASPETVDVEVTALVEGAVARVAGVKEVRSSSEEGNFRIRVVFSPDVDLDSAASDVREAVSRVERQLPEAVEQLTVIKADADASPVMRLAASSETLSEEALTRIVEKDIIPALISIDGVATVNLFGDRERMLRVVVDPLRLTSFGLSVSDVAAVLRNAPFDLPAGSFRSEDQELIVRADATVVTADQVRSLAIRDTVAIGDVAEVFFGAEDAQSYVREGGRRVLGLGIVRQARSNTINISDGVTRVVERLNERFAEVEITLIADDATFIRGSVREVVITLSIAVAIVVATIWLFIGSLRATLIPTVAIPLALIGTVAAIWLIGFSINLLTLLALVLATGMIVDDSIVVLENIQRRRGPGLASRAAAVVGTRQVFFAVVATTVTLVSVFIPISFLPSAAGRLFREFGFVLAIAVTISSFVALSLVPALAARLPEGPPARRRWITALGRWLAGFYARTLHLALNAPVVAGAVALAFGAFAWGLFGILDEELIPPEDRGVLRVFATGPDGVSLSYSDRQADRIEEILQPYVDSGEIERVLTTVGRWDLNRVFAVAPLAPWEQRARSQQEIMAELRRSLSQIPGARVRVSSPNSLGLRASSAAGIEVALLGTDYERIFEAAQAFARGIEEDLPNLSDPDISYQPTQPQLSVHLDRRRASDLGLPLDDIAATLRAMIDGDEIADLNVDDQAIPISPRGRGRRHQRPDRSREPLRPQHRGCAGAAFQRRHDHRGGSGRRARPPPPAPRHRGRRRHRHRLSAARCRRGPEGSGRARPAAGRRDDPAGRGRGAGGNLARGGADLRRRPHRGLPGADRPVRELHVGRGDRGDRALRPCRRGAGDVPDRHLDQHLLADRPRHAHRHHGEERHPGGRVRRPACATAALPCATPSRPRPGCDCVPSS